MILRQTNIATMGWQRADLKHWILLYKGLSVEEVYDALHAKLAKFDLGELTNKDVLVYTCRNGQRNMPYLKVHDIAPECYTFARNKATSLHLDKSIVLMSNAMGKVVSDLIVDELQGEFASSNSSLR